jgi:putative transposase
MNNETYLRSFKIRIFPSKEQEELMMKHVHACRFIWNKCKEIKDNAYKNGEKNISCFDMINKLPDIKEEYPFLKEVANHSLQQIIRDLYFAYEMFFRKISGKPKFKSKKKSKLSFPLRQEERATYFKNEKYVKIPKIGDVPYRFDYRKEYHIVSYRFHNPRISYINGKWILSVGLECEKQAQEPTYKRMGIDLGVEYLATVSFGNKNNCEEEQFRNINKDPYMKKLDSKIKHLNRKLAKQERMNKNYINITGKYTHNMEKTIEKLQKVHYRKRCIRIDYMHKLSCYLVYYKKPLCITMETLRVDNMVKNRHLARVVHEASFNTFMIMIRYKCEWSSCTGFMQVPACYPSSKRCSQCGNIKRDLKLSDRVYICTECGNELNRDINASRNLRDYEYNKNT